MQLNMNVQLDSELKEKFENFFNNAKNMGYSVISETFLLRIALDTSAFTDFLKDKEIDESLLYKAVNEQLVLEKDAQPENPAPELQFTRKYQKTLSQAQSISAYRTQNYMSNHASTPIASAMQSKVTAIDLIIAIASITDTNVAVRRILRHFSITQDILTTYFSNVLKGNDTVASTLSVPAELSAFIKNINESIKSNPEAQIVGREAELERMIQILGRKKKNNPLLLGEEGVGKSSLIEGLAYLINEDKVPEYLKGKQIFAIDIGALVAGTKYRGDFEERLKKVLTFIRSDAKNMMFIDEIHAICGTGSTSEKSTDMSNLLKPALADSLRCIGATTYKESKQFLEKDGGLMRRFQKIDIKQPSPEDTIEILNKIKVHYESYHGITYGENIVETIVHLANKYIANKNFPDKAIDILDEAGVYAKHYGKDTVEKRDIQLIVANMCNIDPNSLISEDADVIQNLHQNMSARVIDQNEAIDKLCETVYLDRAGLLPHDKPKGVFLFTGPTGVGKTETAKALADSLNMKLLRYDMSEYMEKHSVAKLIGTTAGYVGYDDGGKLTNDVSKNPHSIVLLDEIEKASSDIFKILLQIADYGFITDGQGRTVDFRNTIIIMTTNAGATTAGLGSKIGFAKESEVNAQKANYEEAIKATFAPEFRSRLSAIVTYKSLTKEHMLKILNKFIAQTLAHIQTEKKIEVQITDTLKDFLLEKGFDAKLNARPLQEAIRNYVSVPLSKVILFNKINKGSMIEIDRIENESVVKIKEVEFA